MNGSTPRSWRGTWSMCNLTENKRTIPMILLMAAMAGGGSSVLTPKIMPQDWYASDRFTGARADALEKMLLERDKELEIQLERIDDKVDIFVITGPQQIRENQEAIIVHLKDLTSIVRDMQNSQTVHFATRQRWHGHEKKTRDE